ncbi:Conserved Sel1-like TRP-containing protein of unknown function [Magnetospira sp. QH-2]|nr:Conserved Sel1-like TRP-containing protein of unknown function [Magnetospira sp. QH-2]
MVILFVLFATVPARADFETGMAAYEAEDYETAYETWLPLAEAGDPRAQYWIADIHRFGLGQPVFYQAALDWYRKAARQTEDVDTYRRAVYALGYMVNNAQGVTRDIDKAACLYEISAKNNYDSAQWALCLLLAKNSSYFWKSNFWLRWEANNWCHRAADQGNELALGFMGELHLEVSATPNEKGYMKMILAAKLGDQIAARKLHEMKASMSDEEMMLYRKGEKMADAWRAKVEPLPAKPYPMDEDCWP